ncbi:MAG: DNA polymerase ligase N-terminal domain-containing protein [Gemmatimonadota bacterium]|jgi:DNA ligase D-like protein (predicted 3'-phosphoesterase)
MTDSLDSYRKKRDLSGTPEPGGGGSDSGPGRRFVIQEHAASSHHFDLRLELDGVLKSWAVPKGPSTDPRDKRLAVPTEDHPLEYADFEGVIPEGQYGAGAVIVWDAGTWRNLKEDEDGQAVPLADQLAAGHATFWLEGRKISGGYALQRIGEGDDERWLLVKMDDDEADARRNPVSTEPRSVKSGRTVEEVAEGEGDAADDDEEHA